MKKKIFLFLFLSTLFVGCKTFTTPIQGNNVLATDNFDVLGRVSLETNQLSSGYNLLMNEAKKTYPNADDIINILVDKKSKKFLIWHNDKYIF